MANAAEILFTAANEVGTKESPANSNNVKYNTWYYGRAVSGSAYPWCMAFVQWVFHQAGMDLPLKTASCGALKSYAQKVGRWVTSGYRPGDVVLFDFSGKRTKTEHVGIVDAVAGDMLTTIEGNTGTGNDANGGAVMRRKRSASLVTGAYRPKYEGASNLTKDEAKAVLRSVAGLSEATIVYLDSYKFADSLILKLANAMK